MTFPKTQELLDHLRAQGTGNTIPMEQEIDALLDLAKDWERLQAVIEETRLHELHAAPDDEGPRTVAMALRLLARVRQVWDQGERVALFESPVAIADMEAALKLLDGLEVFRMRILAAVKKTGALDMKAFPDDDRLILMVQALLP